jgi:hypothetical protein
MGSCLIPANENEFSSEISESTITDLEVKPNTNRGSHRGWTVDAMVGGINDANQVQNQLKPIVICDNNQYIYCIWEDDRVGDWNVFFTSSANSGAVWSTNISITNYNTSLGNQRNPKIAIHPDQDASLFVVWQDERNDDGDIYFTYSLDHGETWANETQVNPAGIEESNQWYPTVAADKLGNVFVVWSDDSKGNWDIRLSVSSDLGKTWSKSIRLNDPEIENYEQLRPDIVIDSNNNIFVTWEDARLGNKQIFMARSTDHGITFSDNVQVSNSNEFTDSKNSNIFVDDYDNIFLVWLEDYNSRYNAYFSKSLDFGLSFSVPVRVNNIIDACSADASPAVLGDDNGNVYVTWADQRAENHIFLGQSLDNGNSFTVSEKIDDADNSSATGKSITTQEELWRGQVQLTQLESKLFVFWMDYRNDPNPDDAIPHNGDIYYDWNFTMPNRVPEKPMFNKGKITKEWWYINLSWQVSQELDFSKYEVYKSLTKDFTPNLQTLNRTITNRHQNYLNITGLESSKTYYFRLIVIDSGGKFNMSNQLAVSTKVNIPPTIELIEPDGSLDDLVDSSFNIVWEDSDPDDNATIKLYYDTNQNPQDGNTLIGIVPQGEDSSIDFYNWDTSKVKNGSYYISAVISDLVNGELYSIYSPGKLKIYHGDLDPWLTVTFLSPKNITDVDLDQPIVIIFNKRLDMSTVHQDSFYITDNKENNVPGKYEFEKENNKLIFTPNNPWEGLKEYKVFLTTSIRDSTGLFRLDHDYNWWFKTIVEIKHNGTISGEVLDDYYNNSITNAVVTLVDSNNKSRSWSTITDANGEFVFNVPYGSYELSIESESYQLFPTTKFSLSQELYTIPIIKLVKPVLIRFNVKSKISLNEELKVSAFAEHPISGNLTYVWDFGDGTVLNGQNTSHKYKKTGKYTVTLTVSDGNGGVETESEEVEVENATVDSEYLMMVLGISLLILIIGLIIIYLTLYKAGQRRERRMEELKKLDEETRVLPEELDEDEVEEEEEEEDLVEDEDEVTDDEELDDEEEEPEEEDLEEEIDLEPEEILDEDLEGEEGFGRRRGS